MPSLFRHSQLGASGRRAVTGQGLGMDSEAMYISTTPPLNSESAVRVRNPLLADWTDKLKNGHMTLNERNHLPDRLVYRARLVDFFCFASITPPFRARAYNTFRAITKTVYVHSLYPQSDRHKHHHHLPLPPVRPERSSKQPHFPPPLHDERRVVGDERLQRSRAL